MPVPSFKAARRALFRAARAGDLKTLEAVATAAPEAVKQAKGFCGFGITLPLVAASHNQMDFAARAIVLGAGVRGPFGWTPLRMAERNGYPQDLDSVLAKAENGAARPGKIRYGIVGEICIRLACTLAGAG